MKINEELEMIDDISPLYIIDIFDFSINQLLMLYIISVEIQDISRYFKPWFSTFTHLSFHRDPNIHDYR